MDKNFEIVLVEDNESDAELTIHALKKYHLANKLIHLKDGEEALEYFFAKGKYSSKGMDNLPNIILLDLKMPKVNGFEVLKMLKADERTRFIPVVMLTSSNEDKDIKEGYELGINSYIVKPVGFENFVKTVSELGFYWLLLNQSPQRKDGA